MIITEMKIIFELIHVVGSRLELMEGLGSRLEPWSLRWRLFSCKLYQWHLREEVLMGFECKMMCWKILSQLFSKSLAYFAVLILELHLLRVRVNQELEKFEALARNGDGAMVTMVKEANLAFIVVRSKSEFMLMVVVRVVNWTTLAFMDPTIGPCFITATQGKSSKLKQQLGYLYCMVLELTIWSLSQNRHMYFFRAKV